MRRKAIRLLLLGAVASLGALGLTGCLNALRASLGANPTEGVAPLTVTFDLSGSTGGVTGYLLDFGDGTSTQGTDISIPVIHTYGDPGTYTATLTVWNANGRESTASVEIGVEYPELVAKLGADVTDGVVPLTVTFDLSGSQGAIASYSLDFGDGETYPAASPGLRSSQDPDLSAPVVHTYAAPGTYQAVLTVRDRWGRSASDSVEITVREAELRAILNASPESGPAPLEVIFDGSKSVGEIASFALDFGDGESVTGDGTALAEPIHHTYRSPGTYTATLTVSDSRGATDSQSRTIQVEYPPLEAVLSADPTSGEAPLQVTFDLSGSVGPITSFVLNFGDGQIVNGSDVGNAFIHTYRNPGTYTATLWVVDVYGRNDSASVEIEVQ